LLAVEVGFKDRAVVFVADKKIIPVINVVFVYVQIIGGGEFFVDIGKGERKNIVVRFFYQECQTIGYVDVFGVIQRVGKNIRCGIDYFFNVVGIVQFVIYQVVGIKMVFLHVFLKKQAFGVELIINPGAVGVDVVCAEVHIEFP